MSLRELEKSLSLLLPNFFYFFIDSFFCVHFCSVTEAFIVSWGGGEKKWCHPSAFYTHRDLGTNLIESLLLQGCDSTWVIQEFSAENPGEMSVSKGQQVEIVFDSSASSSSLATLPENNATSGMVTVRLTDKSADKAASSSSSSTAFSEGLVPISCLKLPPGGLQQLRSQRPAAIAEHQGEAGECNRHLLVFNFYLRTMYTT